MVDSVEVLIVGAGITGLIAATQLSAAGKSVRVLDKGRGVGGRMATRRIGHGRADHGAQFFTVRTAAFRQHVEHWQKAGLVFEWSRGWSDGSLDDSPPDGYPRYAVNGGMTAVPKYLAQAVDVRTAVTLQRIEPHAAGWRAQDTDGHEYQGHTLILTPPVPQSLALLANGATPLHPSDQQALNQVQYAPCLCALVSVNGTVFLPAPGAIQRPLAPISWMADNQRKGISTDATLITMQAGPQFSASHYEDEDTDLREIFRAALRPHLGKTAVITAIELKRWRYSLPVALHPQRMLQARDLPPLFFAGDGFKEARIEGAVLSGLEAAGALATLS